MKKSLSQLPLFEGRQPLSAEIRVTSKDGIPDDEAPLSAGQNVYLLVKAHIAGVNHEENKDGALVRIHKAQGLAVYRVDEDEAEPIVTAILDERRRRWEERTGQDSLKVRDAMDDITKAAAEAAPSIEKAIKKETGLDAKVTVGK